MLEKKALIRSAICGAALSVAAWLPLAVAHAAAVYTAIDLNPSGFTSSEADGIANGQQVGVAAGPATDFDSHAILWTGTAASAVDLNPSPSGATMSQAYGVADGQQVGFSGGTATGNPHAILWTGTAASAVDLNPSGFTNSDA